MFLFQGDTGRMRRAFLPAAVLLLVAQSVSAQSVQLRMESPVGSGFLWTQIYTRFADSVAERTGGDVRIQVFVNSELSRDTITQFENIQSGTIDGAVVNSQPLSVFDERLNVFSLPFQADDAESYYALLDGPGRALWDDAFRRLGVVGLTEAASMGGFRQLTNSVRPVRRVADLQGMTIRMPGSPLYRDIWGTLGVNTSSMSFGEMLAALETRLVDGQENPVNIIEAGQLYNLQSFVTIWNYSNSALTFAFNPDSWSSLSAEQQQILREEAVAAMAWHRDEVMRVDDELLESYRARNAFTEITVLSPEELSEFRDAMSPVYAIWTERLGADVIGPFLPN